MEPDHVEALATAFAAIGDNLVGHEPEPLLLLAVQQVPGCEWASMTTITEGTGRTLAAIDDVAAAADRVQHELGEGPCMQAARATVYHTIFPTSGDDDERWPNLAAELERRTPVRSVLVVHMLETDPTSINLYASTPYAFTRTSTAVAAIIAGQAASMLTADNPQQDMHVLSDSLAHQRELDVAIEVLVAGGVPREDALGALMEAARHLHHTLRSVAQHVTEHGELPPTA